MNNNKGINQQSTQEPVAGKKRFVGKWLVAALVCVGVVIVLIFLSSMRNVHLATPGNNPSTFTVRRDDLLVTVTEGGSIRARKTIEVKCQVDTHRDGVRITSIVPEGTYITQEDVNNDKVLVRLDSASEEEELTQREIDFASSEASFTQAKEANDIQVKQNESDITAAELKVKFALMDYRKYLGETLADEIVNRKESESVASINMLPLLEEPELGGEASQELRRLNDEITLSMANLENAINTLEWTEKLYEKKYVAETELRRDRLEKQSLEIKKEKAKIDLELFKLYEFPKQAEELLSDYEEAKRELARTYARARSKLAQAQADLKSAESRYESRKERLNRTKRNIEFCIITAPAPGLVTYGSGESGERYRRMRGSAIIAEGEMVYERQTIISLPDMTEMIAEIDVHESSVDKVRPGQRATIVMDAFPDRTLEGEVLKVAPLPNQDRSWFSPDLKVYTTQVPIEGTHDFLKPGMSAKVEILVERLEDVIIVPVQVVGNQGGKKVCYCLTPRGIEKRVVQTGSFNDTFVQVTDGLEVGEEVLLSPPRLTEAEPEDESEPQVESESKPEAVEQQPPEKDGRRPKGRQFELTDEIIEATMANLNKTNPEKAQELEQLRKSDPEKFKAELRKVMREQFGRPRRDRGDKNRGPGNATGQ
ncbi:MAG: efflux RND transporter periplasmic adaptor subunit [Planctomycetota bacterium]|jgi:multidrug resistance efflux pump